MKKGLVFALALILVTALVPCLSAADAKITVWCWDPEFQR